MGPTTVVTIYKDNKKLLNVQINKNLKHFMLSRSNSTNKAQKEKIATKRLFNDLIIAHLNWVVT